MALGTVYVADLEDTAEDARGVLLVELRGLCQICLLAEVVELLVECGLESKLNMIGVYLIVMCSYSIYYPTIA